MSVERRAVRALWRIRVWDDDAKLATTVFGRPPDWQSRTARWVTYFFESEALALEAAPLAVLAGLVTGGVTTDWRGEMYTEMGLDE